MYPSCFQSASEVAINTRSNPRLDDNTLYENRFSPAASLGDGLIPAPQSIPGQILFGEAGSSCATYTGQTGRW